MQRFTRVWMYGALVAATAIAGCADEGSGTGGVDGAPRSDAGGADGGVRADAAAASDAGVDAAVGDASPPSAGTESVRIISWNAFFKNSRSNFEDALAAFEKHEIDIVGFQEVATNGKLEALIAATGCPGCFYDAWIPGVPDEGGSVSIMWRKDRFSVAENAEGKMQYVVQVHGREEVESRNGGTTLSRPVYITSVRLEDAWTGRAFWIVNTHALAQVESPKNCGHPSSKERRLELYELAMSKLVEGIGNKGRIFVTGDFNVNYRCDRNVKHVRFPWSNVNGLQPRVKSNWQWHEEAGEQLPAIGTIKPHEGNKRLIDYVFGRAHPSVTYGGFHIWAKQRFGSDHTPVRATYRITTQN